jgi:ribosomal protein L7/L12
MKLFFHIETDDGNTHTIELKERHRQSLLLVRSLLQEELKKTVSPICVQVRIKEIGVSKINLIKAIRGLTNLDLKEAKDLVESAPNAVVFPTLRVGEVPAVKQALERAGATVAIERVGA